MKLTVKKPREMQYIGRQIERDIRNFLTVRIVTALKEFHRSLLDTPVYTGRTLINYRWSIGTPVEDRRAAVKNPLLPGKTSDLGIGSEPRRAANQSVIDAEFNTLVSTLLREKNPYQKIFLRNNMPNFDDIEYGNYSNNSRTPAGGMTRRGEAKIKLIIRGIEKVG
jgi:hypothetical protein